MKIMLDNGAYAPVRAHETDAGLDLRAKYGVLVPAHGFATVGTGTHVQLPKGTAGVLVSKSGLNVLYGITSTGLIDEGYTGEIMVKLYNNGNRDYQVEAGDKISQMVVIQYMNEPIELVDSLDMDTERGSAGFGSTGK